MTITVEMNYSKEAKEWNIAATDSEGKILISVVTNHPGIAAMIINRVSEDFIKDTSFHSNIKSAQS